MRSIFLAVVLSTSTLAYAGTTAPLAKEAPKVAVPTATTTPAVVPDKVELPPPLTTTHVAPTTVPEGVSTGKALVTAIKAKAWWLVTALSVFIVMLACQLFGLFAKIGKRWTWILAGALTLAAAFCFSIVDAGKFSWGAVITFCTAGPTVAWMRGFVKKAILDAGGKVPAILEDEKKA